MEKTVYLSAKLPLKPFSGLIKHQADMKFKRCDKFKSYDALIDFLYSISTVVVIGSVFVE